MEITREYLQEHFDYDACTGAFHRRSNGKMAGSQHSRGYIDISIGRKLYKAHRLVWMLFHGVWPVGVDHINGRNWDNRLENLRVADQTLNNRNARIRKDNATGLSGVHRAATGLWVVQIGTDDGRKCLYQGKDFFEACCRRKAAELKHDYTGRT